MAVIWQKKVSANHYEVRTAGNSVRLYKNGVFHSQWNDQRPLSNGVWDLLFLPALFYPVQRVKRVLVLGVGGGAVINQFSCLLQPETIIGVELDPVHLMVARRFFGVNGNAVELVEADALSWLANYRGEKFDIIIEDLFTEVDGEPVRVAPAGEAWLSALLSHLQPHGSLVINFEDAAQMRNSTPPYLACKGERPDARFRFTQPSYGNSVCAFMGQEGSVPWLRKQLDVALAPYPACRATGQKFKIRRVK